MNFNKHYDLEGKHAFLGASRYHWINYTETKLIDTYSNFLAAQKGTELHESENNVETLSGAIVIVGGTLGYMIAESKVDAARVKEAVDAAEKMIDAIKDETE